MKRRDVISLLAGATAWPVMAHAQPPHVPVIGMLALGIPDPVPFVQGVRNGLAELGYAEGRNIRFEARSAEGNANRMAELAADLVHLKVDVIVTFQTPAATAAKQATSEIPIVMATSGDPIGTGLVASLARPGGNVTGLSSATAEIAGKSVELIREVLPAARRIAVLGSATDPFTQPFVAQVSSAIARLGMEMVPMMMRQGQSLEDVFEPVAGKPADALVIQGSIARKEVIDFALKHRLPAFSSNQLTAQLGSMVTYAASQEDMFRRSAGYVDRILKGAKPADLPVQQPVKFELIFNLKTAQALGIEVSPILLARADQVIE